MSLGSVGWQCLRLEFRILEVASHWELQDVLRRSRMEKKCRLLRSFSECSQVVDSTCRAWSCRFGNVVESLGEGLAICKSGLSTNL